MWYIVRRREINTFFTTSTSRKLRGESFISPCAICPSIILLTRFDIVSSLYSFRLLEAASVASAIMSNDVSLLRGFGPGYVKGSGSTGFPPLLLQAVV